MACIGFAAKKMKMGTSTLALVVLALLVGAGSAHALDIVLDDDGFSVLAINNLDLGDVGTYNVAFLYTTAIDLYGDDVRIDFDEENAALAMIAVNEVLNDDGRAHRAGSESTLPYAIAVDLTNEGPLAALASKYYPFGQQDRLGSVDPMTWDSCRFPACTPGGAMLLDPNEYVTYAHFTVVPEPGTAVLMGLGLLGLGVGGRRRE